MKSQFCIKTSQVKVLETKSQEITSQHNSIQTICRIAASLSHFHWWVNNLFVLLDLKRNSQESTIKYVA